MFKTVAPEDARGQLVDYGSFQVRPKMLKPDITHWLLPLTAFKTLLHLDRMFKQF